MFHARLVFYVLQTVLDNLSCMLYSSKRGVLLTTCRLIYKEESVMAYVISDECLMCGACADQCPVGAISEGDGKYVIDADACLECGACADQCPAGAIAQE